MDSARARAKPLASSLQYKCDTIICLALTTPTHRGLYHTAPSGL